MVPLRTRFATVAAALVLCACASSPREGGSSHRPDSLQAAIDEAMAESRRAIDELGETPAAMARIQGALDRLARVPGLRERASMGELHRSSSMQAGILASEGEEGITLIVVRFAAGSTTPVHDHLTWGVVHVLEGRDKYVEWRRVDDGTDSARADLHSEREIVLGPGQSTYWLGPPADIHSQEALDGDVWEIVMAGKNLLGSIVQDHRHNFDVETGR
jgi:predicted metal-dependent enzyme (double-stranded beta helix superfamily)